MMSSNDYIRLFLPRQIRYVELLRLSLTQRQCILDDDYPQLLTVLGMKQRLLEDLDELAREQPGLKDQWLRDRARLPSDQRAECEKLLALTEAVLAQLTEHEQVCGHELESRRELTRKQLQAVATGSRAQTEYFDSLASESHRHLNIDQ